MGIRVNERKGKFVPVGVSFHEGILGSGCTSQCIEQDGGFSCIRALPMPPGGRNPSLQLSRTE